MEPKARRTFYTANPCPLVKRNTSVEVQLLCLSISSSPGIFCYGTGQQHEQEVLEQGVAPQRFLGV